MNPNLSTTVFTRFEDADGRRIWEILVQHFKCLHPKYQAERGCVMRRFHPIQQGSIAEGVMDWVALSSKDYAAASFYVSNCRALSVTSSDTISRCPSRLHQTCPAQPPKQSEVDLSCWSLRKYCTLKVSLGFHRSSRSGAGLSLREPGFYGGSHGRSGATTRLQHLSWFPLCQAILKRGFEATSLFLPKPSSLQTRALSQALASG